MLKHAVKKMSSFHNYKSMTNNNDMSRIPTILQMNYLDTNIRNLGKKNGIYVHPYNLCDIVRPEYIESLRQFTFDFKIIKNIHHPSCTGMSFVIVFKKFDDRAYHLKINHNYYNDTNNPSIDAKLSEIDNYKSYKIIFSSDYYLDPKPKNTDVKKIINNSKNMQRNENMFYHTLSSYFDNFDTNVFAINEELNASVNCMIKLKSITVNDFLNNNFTYSSLKHWSSFDFPNIKHEIYYNLRECLYDLGNDRYIYCNVMEFRSGDVNYSIIEFNSLDEFLCSIHPILARLDIIYDHTPEIYYNNFKNVLML